METLSFEVFGIVFVSICSVQSSFLAVLQKTTMVSSEEHVVCWELNLGQHHAKQASYASIIVEAYKGT